ncbi:unnamed protein product [Brachionus calyciflorus]|uniref:Uncharacterized protein n=1 Tax=Brachionus calyciflorus TaxID=104777 RepID=A0A813ZC02_9BILA|nr:unnamed protein product [Brachionus calyciflorus]
MYLAMKARDENPPSEDVLRRIKHEENNCLNDTETKVLNKINHDWYDKLRARAVTFNRELQTEYLNGFVEKLAIFLILR